jgi:hypothetical protein
MVQWPLGRMSVSVPLLVTISFVAYRLFFTSLFEFLVKRRIMPYCMSYRQVLHFVTPVILSRDLAPRLNSDQTKDRDSTRSGAATTQPSLVSFQFVSPLRS